MYLILYLFCIILNYGNCANILGLMGVPSPSHHIWNSALMHELGKRGHNVTVLSVNVPKPKDIPNNLHYIYLEEVYNTIYSTHSNENINITDYIGLGPIEGIPGFYEFGYKTLMGAVKSKGFDILLNYPDTFKFDLIIHDFTIGPYLIGFAHKFKYPPIVAVTAFLNPPSSRDQVGGHYFPSYVPHFNTIYDTDMSFCQRMYNTLIYFIDVWYSYYIAYPKQHELIKHKYPSDMPYLSEIAKKSVITLVNSHPAVTYPEPLPSNVIEVGGMQIKDVKPLPDDLETFAKNSKKGLILFSLGTNIRVIDFGPEKINSILSAMEQLPEYNFIWKTEENSVTRELPKNVLIRSFLPQSDILGHPKIKAFISHGGGLSTQEATWRGVPIIGIALFMDQIRNLHKSVLWGVAEEVNFFKLNTDILRNTIKKVVENEKYSKNMKLRSSLFRDRPMKPLDTAVWWVEYVLRHPKPSHLQSPTLNMSYIAANSLDFVFIVIVLILIKIWILRIIFLNIKKCFNSEHKIDKTKKKL